MAKHLFGGKRERYERFTQREREREREEKTQEWGRRSNEFVFVAALSIGSGIGHKDMR